MTEQDWKDILELARSKLAPDDFKTVCDCGTLEALVNLSRELQSEYEASRPYHVNRLNGFVQQLNAFNSTFDIMTSVNQDQVAPLWGSIKLSIELVKGAQEVFEMIVDMFHEISGTMPRINIYIKALEESEDIEDFRTSCRTVNVLIAEFSCLVIAYYRTHPLRNILQATWTPFKPDFERVVTRLKQATRQIELEAQAIAMRNTTSRQEEIWRLLAPLQAQIIEPKIPCHYLGQPRNPQFKGRAGILTDIDSALNPTKIRKTEKSQKIFTLYGLGGVGKTQTAIAYAHAHLEDFKIVFWIAADTETKIAMDIRGAITKLGLIAKDSKDDDKAVVAKFKGWLDETEEPWLIIFDNADEVTYLKDFWPTADHGSILLTSRTQTLPRMLAPYGTSTGKQIMPLSDAEGAELIMSLINVEDGANDSSDSGSPAPADWDVVDRSDANDPLLLAKSLTKQLGGLPLAIAQIAAYILDTGTDLELVLELLSSSQDRSELIVEVGAGATLSYSHTLTNVWDISISHIPDHSKHLLQLLCFYDNDSIPESLFMEKVLSKDELATYPDMQYLSTKAKYLTTKKSLLQHCLINKGEAPHSLAVHRLVSEITLGKMSPKDTQQRFNEVVHLIYRLYPTLRPEETYLNLHWPKLRLYLPHVLNLEKEYRERATLEPTREFAVILCNAIWFMFEQNNLQKVAELLPTLRGIAVATKDGNEFIVAQMYRTYMVVNLDTRNYRPALDYALKMLETLKSIEAQDKLLPADGYNAVGLCMMGVDDYDGAESNLMQSIALREEFPDRNPGMRGISMANMAVKCNLNGEYDRALDFGQRALKLVEGHYGQGSFKSAEVRAQIGNAYIGLNRLDDALAIHTIAMNIRKETFGTGYKFAASLHKVASILTRQSEYQDAEKLLQNALQIYNDAYKTRGELGRTSYLMATVLQALGKQEDAANTKKLAAEIRKEILGLNPDQEDNQASYDLLIPFEQR